MSLADALAKATTVKGPSCKMRAIFDVLDPGEAKVLAVALADPLTNAATIRRALIAEGYELGIGVVQRHRRGECLCAV